MAFGTYSKYYSVQGGVQSNVRCFVTASQDGEPGTVKSAEQQTSRALNLLNTDSLGW